MNALTFFVESSTLGTILVLVVYFLANLALPFYYRKFRPAEFNVVRHAILPVLGMVAIAVPMYYLCKPGQPAPYDWFPYRPWPSWSCPLIYGYFLNRRDPVARRPGGLYRRRRVAGRCRCGPSGRAGQTG